MHENTVFDAGEAGFQGAADCDLVAARINAHRKRAARAQQRRACSDDFALSDLSCSVPAWPGSFDYADCSDEVLLEILQRECSELEDLMAEPKRLLQRQQDFEELHCLDSQSVDLL